MKLMKQNEKPKIYDGFKIAGCVSFNRQLVQQGPGAVCVLLCLI
jgi:hypothetical protein